jgi:hypothetical protein
MAVAAENVRLKSSTGRRPRFTPRSPLRLPSHAVLSRRAREELLLDPAAHPFARVKNEDVGEPGCCDWHVRPRFGLLGMLAGWWRVVVSSGCPLPLAG